jgi:hypothetical protein
MWYATVGKEVLPPEGRCGNWQTKRRRLCVCSKIVLPLWQKVAASALELLSGLCTTVRVEVTIHVYKLRKGTFIQDKSIS